MLIVVFNRYGRGLMRVGAIMIGIVCGYLLCAVLGDIDFTPVFTASWASVPRPLRYGLSFDWHYLLPFCIAYVVTTIESIGDLTATCAVSKLLVSGKVYRSRLSGGILTDGVGSAFAALFNSLPNTTFSQNIGVIQLTGVACRAVGIVTAVILVVLGLLPKLAALVSIMPQPVLGGATITMFGLVAAAGIRIATAAGLEGRNLIVFSTSLAVGLGVTFVPEALQGLPETVQATFGSGLNAGAVFAIALNLILPADAEPEAR
jgi:NCS2 family nucleobase:cation symporter-2/xanthine permease XanP